MQNRFRQFMKADTSCGKFPRTDYTPLRPAFIQTKKARRLAGLRYQNRELTSFGFSFHHHEVLLLGSLRQHFTVDTLFLLRLGVTNKVGKGALGALSKT